MQSITPNIYRYHIGIDPGVNTGFAVWDRHDQHFLCVVTVKIHEAMNRIQQLKKEFPGQIFVRFEDARLRKWFQNKGTAQLQGAGSIKRDCTIWEQFLTDHEIPFIGREPVKGMTKWSTQIFNQTTGWAGRTDDHARDAAVLVFKK